MSGRDGEAHAERLDDRLLARPQANQRSAAQGCRQPLELPAFVGRAHPAGEIVVGLDAVAALDVHADAPRADGAGHELAAVGYGEHEPVIAGDDRAASFVVVDDNRRGVRVGAGGEQAHKRGVSQQRAVAVIA